MTDEEHRISLQTFVERVMTERDDRYGEMFESSKTAAATALAAQEKAVAAALAAQEKAVSAALAAQEKAVASAFEASEKAIVKAEVAQTAFNERSNEFRKALDDNGKLMLPRTEADVQFRQIRELIDAQGKAVVDLQRGESRGEGGSKARDISKTQSQWVVPLVVTIALWVLGGLATLIFFLVTKGK